MTTAQVVETSVTVNNCSIQGYVHPDDHTHSTYEMTAGFKTLTVTRILLTWFPTGLGLIKANSTFDSFPCALSKGCLEARSRDLLDKGDEVGKN